MREITEQGRVVDWGLEVSTTTCARDANVVAAFASWRSAYATDFALGEQGFISALLAQAEDRRAGGNSASLDLTTLSRAAVRIENDRVPELTDSLESLCCSMRARAGWGLFAAPEATGSSDSGQRAGRGPSAPERQDVLLRALVPTEPATTLLATPTAAVGVDHAGLRLMLRRLTVLGWTDAGAETLVLTPRGEYAIRSVSLSASLLRRLGHQRPHAELREVPLPSLAASFVDGLARAATLASTTGGAVEIRTAPAAASTTSRAR